MLHGMKRDADAYQKTARFAKRKLGHRRKAVGLDRALVTGAVIMFQIAFVVLMLRQEGSLTRDHPMFSFLRSDSAEVGIPVNANFPLCGEGRRYTCTVDGDTVWLAGEKIRLAGIDAPELSSPDCASERALAHEATIRLSEILSSREWHLVREGKDRYGRTLATFHSSGETAGSRLVREGLARPWGGRKESWCL